MALKRGGASDSTTPSTLCGCRLDAKKPGKTRAVEGSKFAMEPWNYWPPGCDVEVVGEVIWMTGADT
jgi:hypothetical protein